MLEKTIIKCSFLKMILVNISVNKVIASKIVRTSEIVSKLVKR